ncbi:uncharacterized protein LOC117654076 [Thrips palmi]|uniref:Uncharacterized protein LOC117654076 n=1 Tax=Thrips palmi TaxID=161013 RepID=A0A6P9AD22_THRPL|nr:uncharacterized protein LOC117654076 [Thrips palmi]
MAARNVLFALAVVLLLGAVLADHNKRPKSKPLKKGELSLDVMPYGARRFAGLHGAADVQLHHHLTKRFFGVHIHKRPKVYLVNQVPQQVVYIRKHHRHHAFQTVVQPSLSVHLGHRHHRHRHHHARFNVHLGLGH